MRRRGSARSMPRKPTAVGAGVRPTEQGVRSGRLPPRAAKEEAGGRFFFATLNNATPTPSRTDCRQPRLPETRPAACRRSSRCRTGREVLRLIAEHTRDRSRLKRGRRRLRVQAHRTSRATPAETVVLHSLLPGNRLASRAFAGILTPGESAMKRCSGLVRRVWRWPGYRDVLVAQPASARVSLLVSVWASASTTRRSAAASSADPDDQPGLSDTPTNVTIEVDGTLTRCSSSKTGSYGSLTATINIPSATCAKWEGAKLTGLPARPGATRRSQYSLTFGSAPTTMRWSRRSPEGDVGPVHGRPVSAEVKFRHVGSPNCATRPVTDLTFTNTRPFIIS